MTTTTRVRMAFHAVSVDYVKLIVLASFSFSIVNIRKRVAVQLCSACFATGLAQQTFSVVRCCRPDSPAPYHQTPATMKKKV